jgi:hypothetical protein
VPRHFFVMFDFSIYGCSIMIAMLPTSAWRPRRQSSMLTSALLKLAFSPLSRVAAVQGLGSSRQGRAAAGVSRPASDTAARSHAHVPTRHRPNPSTGGNDVASRENRRPPGRSSVNSPARSKTKNSDRMHSIGTVNHDGSSSSRQARSHQLCIDDISDRRQGSREQQPGIGCD